MLEGVANGMPWSGDERNHLYFGGIPGAYFEDYSGIWVSTTRVMADRFRSSTTTEMDVLTLSWRARANHVSDC